MDFRNEKHTMVLDTERKLITLLNTLTTQANILQAVLPFASNISTTSTEIKFTYRAPSGKPCIFTFTFSNDILITTKTSSLDLRNLKPSRVNHFVNLLTKDVTTNLTLKTEVLPILLAWRKEKDL